MTLGEGQSHQSQGGPETKIYTCFCYKGKILMIFQHNSSARANIKSALTPVLSERTWYILLYTPLLTLPQEATREAQLYFKVLSWFYHCEDVLLSPAH